jgi:hypothetical protein
VPGKPQLAVVWLQGWPRHTTDGERHGPLLIDRCAADNLPHMQARYTRHAACWVWQRLGHLPRQQHSGRDCQHATARWNQAARGCACKGALPDGCEACPWRGVPRAGHAARAACRGWLWRRRRAVLCELHRRGIQPGRHADRAGIGSGEGAMDGAGAALPATASAAGGTPHKTVARNGTTARAPARPQRAVACRCATS